METVKLLDKVNSQIAKVTKDLGSLQKQRKDWPVKLNNSQDSEVLKLLSNLFKTARRVVSPEKGIKHIDFFVEDAGSGRKHLDLLIKTLKKNKLLGKYVVKFSNSYAWVKGQLIAKIDFSNGKVIAVIEGPPTPEKEKKWAKQLSAS